MMAPVALQEKTVAPPSTAAMVLYPMAPGAFMLRCGLSGPCSSGLAFARPNILHRNHGAMKGNINAFE